MGFKDKIVSAGVEKAFNSYLHELGEITSFAIDSKRKTIDFTISLIGETEPIRITTKEYELLRDNEKQYFIIHDLSASRQWINILFRKFLKDRKIEIPPKYDFIIRGTM